MSETDSKISRRTLARGASWAAPAIAVTAMAPTVSASVATTTTTLPPCVSALGTTGGTYPVSVSLSGCSVANVSSHWDFIFSIKAAIADAKCLCNGTQPTHLRITIFDNPGRTRWWISNGFGSLLPLSPGSDDPQDRTQNDPRLYVQKVLAAGATALFPASGDPVRRVGGTSPYTGYVIDTGTAAVGNISASGTADDSLHTLMLPGGGIPSCSPAVSGPMAYIRVDCGTSQTGPWTQLGGIGEINPCVPMIQATVCRFSTAGNSRYRLGISVLNSCGLPVSRFRITNIQRNSSSDFPNDGTSVWSGDQQLGLGTTDISMTSEGSGGQLWISFTTDTGPIANANISRIRVPTNNTACAGGCTSAPAVPGVGTACRVSGTSNANSIHRYSWTAVTGATSYNVRYSTSTSNNIWTTVTGASSPYTTTAPGVRRLQVQAVNDCGSSGWSSTTSVGLTTDSCPAPGFAPGSEEGTADTLIIESGAETTGQTSSETSAASTTQTTESSTTEAGDAPSTEPSDQ